MQLSYSSTNGKHSLTSEISRLSLSAFKKKTSKVMASSSGISRFADLVSLNEFPKGHGKKTKENIALLTDFFYVKNES